MNSLEQTILKQGLELLDQASQKLMAGTNNPHIAAYAKIVHGLIALGEEILPLVTKVE